MSIPTNEQIKELRKMYRRFRKSYEDVEKLKDSGASEEARLMGVRAYSNWLRALMNLMDDIL